MLTGYCQCGCGQKTSMARQTDKERGNVKGCPVKYLRGHAPKNKGRENHNWKGGRYITPNGYVNIKTAGHPRANPGGYVFEHILVCERILGKHLPPGAVPHHINENKIDNRPENLVICQDRAYHNLLHQRTRALLSCGNASWRKCPFCKTYDDPNNLITSKGRKSAYHKECENVDQRQRRKKPLPLF